jgi:predicted nucleotidyltransferase
MGRGDIERICLEIADDHGCHTAILYGSRARGSATDSSDVDLACFRDGGTTTRDARRVGGIYYDAFVYPVSVALNPEPFLVRLHPGVVLREREDFGSAFLVTLGALYDRGPAPLRADERMVLVLWAHKTLARLRGQTTVEAAYRRSQLLNDALPDYFALRGMWFRGPREALVHLDEEDPRVHRTFARAMQPGASDGAIAELVVAVYGPEP